MIAYKLMRLRKDGTLGSLFINRKAVIPVGVWMKAEDHPTKGYAHRPGWHCTLEMSAPHMKEEGRVWVEVEVAGYEFFQRPPHQGGQWVLAQWCKVIEIIRRG